VICTNPSCTSCDILDPGAADWRHFGRLAGFTNRKPKHERTDGLYPYVQILDQQAGLVYPHASGFLEGIRGRLRDEELLRTSLMSHARVGVAGPLKTIDDFRADPSYGADGNRIDLAFAVYALAHGF
jgi:hypothetical protein